VRKWVIEVGIALGIAFGVILIFVGFFFFIVGMWGALFAHGGLYELPYLVMLFGGSMLAAGIIVVVEVVKTKMDYRNANCIKCNFDFLWPIPYFGGTYIGDHWRIPGDRRNYHPPEDVSWCSDGWTEKAGCNLFYDCCNCGLGCRTMLTHSSLQQIQTRHNRKVHSDGLR